MRRFQNGKFLLGLTDLISFGTFKTFDCFYDVTLDGYERNLYLRITVLPGLAANVVAIVITDSLNYICVLVYKICAGAAIFSSPAQFVTNLVSMMSHLP